MSKLEQVAKLAGVSKATVSRVINNGALLYLPVDLCHMHIGKQDEQ